MAAVDYALHLRPESKVVVHYREPRKVTFARIEAKAGQNPSLREQVIR
jgi:hypothetical protein